MWNIFYYFQKISEWNLESQISYTNYLHFCFLFYIKIKKNHFIILMSFLFYNFLCVYIKYMFIICVKFFLLFFFLVAFTFQSFLWAFRFFPISTFNYIFQLNLVHRKTPNLEIFLNFLIGLNKIMEKVY